MWTRPSFLLMLCLSASPEAVALGRLFHSPAQRLQLEQQQAPARPTLNGIVQRHGGVRTVWINGQPLVKPGTDRADSQTLELSGQPPLRLKVGERVP